MLETRIQISRVLLYESSPTLNLLCINLWTIRQCSLVYTYILLICDTIHMQEKKKVCFKNTEAVSSSLMGTGCVEVLIGCNYVCSPFCPLQCYIFLHLSNHTDISLEESPFPYFISSGGKSQLLSVTHQSACAWDTSPLQGLGAAAVFAGVGTLVVLL